MKPNYNLCNSLKRVTNTTRNLISNFKNRNLPDTFSKFIEEQRLIF